MKTFNPKITVYIPNHNYNLYFKKSIESVLCQTYKNFELFLILDGSDKLARKIADYYQKKDQRIKIFINKKKMGLRYSANLAINNSKGSYITRLDADDFFSTKALKIFVNFLKSNKNIDLVYSDFYYVDKNGNIIDTHSNEKIINKESLLNIPAHGACSLVKKNTLKKIGGYKNIFDAQDGYELWLNLIKKKKSIGNINTPLFYYRQHDVSMSTNEDRILNARREIKRYFVEKNKLLKNKKILFIVGARNKNNILKLKINKKYLIDYCLKELSFFKKINYKILVSTDDSNLKKYIETKYLYKTYMRPEDLSLDYVNIDNIVFDACIYAKSKLNFKPDIVLFINSMAPCISKDYIQKALDTLVLFNTDSVISVYEDLDLHYRHTHSGLEKISKRMHHQLRIYRDSLLVDNRCIRIAWFKKIRKNNMLGKKIGHCTMKRSESINIKNDYDIWLTKKYINERDKIN